MATVYTVSIGSRYRVEHFDGLMNRFDKLVTLTMIDSSGDIDKWHADGSTYYWRKQGDWRIRLTTKEILVYTEDLGELLATFKSIRRWPMEVGDNAEAELTFDVNGQKKFIYYVDKVE